METLGERVNAFDAVDGGPEGKKLILAQRDELGSEALAEESEQMALVPDF